jgi:hypothetical protein
VGWVYHWGCLCPDVDGIFVKELDKVKAVGSGFREAVVLVMRLVEVEFIESGIGVAIVVGSRELVEVEFNGSGIGVAIIVGLLLKIF